MGWKKIAPEKNKIANNTILCMIFLGLLKLLDFGGCNSVQDCLLKYESILCTKYINLAHFSGFYYTSKINSVLAISGARTALNSMGCIYWNSGFIKDQEWVGAYNSFFPIV